MQTYFEKPKVEISRLDRIISAIAPRWGLQRLRSKVNMARAEATLTGMGWIGGRYDRKSMQEYGPSSASQPTEYHSQQRTIRARSRDLVRNSPIGGAATGTAVTNVVGTGLRLYAHPDMNVLGLSREEFIERRQELENLWRYVKDDLDFEGDIDQRELQSLAFQSVLESGDVLMVRRQDLRQGNLIGLKVQLIESDRITNPKNAMDTIDIAGGVEVDRNGRPRAFHVQNHHPGDYLRMRGKETWSRIPAYGTGGIPLARLLFERERPGQRRGVPFLASVIEPLKMITELGANELAASVVTSLFAVFVKTERPAIAGLPMSPEGTDEGDQPKKQGDIFLNPAAVIDLEPGAEIQTADPNRPNDAYDPFFRAIVQQIGARLQIPYEQLIKLYGQSYSASRAALLDAFRFYRNRRKFLGRRFLAPMYEWAVNEAVLRGLVDLPGFMEDDLIRKAWLQAEWIGDSPGAINEKDAAMAAQIRMDARISNRTIESQALLGLDWQTEIYPQAREEHDQMIADGLEPELPDPNAIDEPGNSGTGENAA